MRINQRRSSNKSDIQAIHHELKPPFSIDFLRMDEEASQSFREKSTSEGQEETLRWQPWSFTRGDNEATDAVTSGCMFRDALLCSLSLSFSLSPSLITEKREYDDDDNDDFGPRCTAPRSFLRVMADDFVGNIAKGEIRRPRNLSTWVWYNMHRTRILVISSNRVFGQI